MLDLIFRMLEKDESKRISMNEALQSEWIHKNCDLPLCSKSCLINIKDFFESNQN